MAEVRLPLQSSGPQLSRVLASDAGLGDVLSVLEADPALALEVLPLAAQAPRVDGRLRSLQQAVNLIGVSRIQALLQARLRRKMPANALAESLSAQALETSRLATQLVTVWAWQRHAGDLDHLVWATWLMGVTRWKLPWVDTDAAQRIASRVAGGERRTQVEREVLGCDLEMLNAWHLQDIGLGQASELRQAYMLPPSQLARAARLGWTGDFPPEVPPILARDLHRPTTGCGLAYGLALETEHGWYGQRLQRLMSVISAHLARPVSQVRHQAMDRALTIARGQRPGSPPPPVAERLLWPAKPPGRPVPLASSRVPTESPSARPAEREASPSGFLDRCARSDFTDLASFLRSAQHSLHEELECGRHALLLRQGNTEDLACPIVRGLDVAEPLPSVRLTWSANPITARLMQHPSGSLWVRAGQMQAARARLPSPLVHWCSDSGFAMFTVNVNGRAAGLWWVAPDPTQPALDEARVQSLRRWVHAFGLEFTAQMRRRQRSTVST